MAENKNDSASNIKSVSVMRIREEITAKTGNMNANSRLFHQNNLSF